MTKMCYHPWVGLDISPQGQFKPCCKYKDVISKSFDGYNNSDALRVLREEFLEGKQPQGCARCWRDEESGLESKRQMDNKYIFNNTSPALDSIKVLSLPFGNTCNLACRICNSYSSSKWRDEALQLKTVFPEIRVFDHVKFYDDQAFMDPIFDLLPNIIHIDIPGGEPFVAKTFKHQQLIDKLAETNPQQVSIHYTTNLTRFPAQSFWDQWQKFKQVDIQFSIDGTGDHFEYNRWPAVWDECFQHIKQYQAKQQAHKNLKLSISHSVSIFTVLYLPEFLDWCKTNNLPDPWLGLISTPPHYNITVLPKNVKEAVEQKISNYPQLQPIIDAMWAKDDSDQFDISLKYVKILDKHRRQNFAETFNQLYNLLDEKCQTLYQQF